MAGSNYTTDEKLGLLVDSEEEEIFNAQDEELQKKKDFTLYEDAIEATGNGRYHILLLIVCGWAVSSDAIEILSLSFALPPASCDMQLTAVMKGWLNASMFIGMLIGGYLWGSLADKIGRRKVLLGSLTINGLAGLASSFAQIYWLFLLCRLISGIGVGGSMPVVFTYFSEFQSKKRRGAMISALATFWMGGNIIAAGLAWVVILYSRVNVVLLDFSYSSWRLYLSVCTLPSLTSVLIFLLMPESPKFLLLNGKEQDSLLVLRKIYMVNNRTSSLADFQVNSLMLYDSDSKESSAEQKKLLEVKRTPSNFKNSIFTMLQSTREIFQKPLLHNTCVLLAISFTLSFGYYGLWMWFPEIFNKIEKYGGSVCVPGKPHNLTNNTVTECTPPNNNIYFDGFLTALSNLPGNIFTIFLMDKIGRKILLVSSMVISGASVFSILLISNRTTNLIVSCVFGGVSVIGWNALDVLSTELFPTKIRSTGIGVQSTAMRLGAITGNLVFGSFVELNCSIPLIMVSTLLIVGGLMAFRLPDMTGRDIL